MCKKNAPDTLLTNSDHHMYFYIIGEERLETAREILSGAYLLGLAESDSRLPSAILGGTYVSSEAKDSRLRETHKRSLRFERNKERLKLTRGGLNGIICYDEKGFNNRIRTKPTCCA